MQHLDNDMDELFQRAAEDYPLRTSDSNWDEIAVRLSGAGKSQIQQRKKGRGIISTSLLLLGFILAGISLQKDIDKSELAHGENALPVNMNNSAREAELSTAKSLNAGISLNRIFQNEYRRDGESVVMDHYIIGKSESKVFVESNIRPKRNPGLKTYREELTGGISEARFLIEKKKLEHPKEKPSLAVTSGNEISQKAAPDINKKKQRFYWGIAAGPQLNEVKQQGRKRVGVEAGVTAGYRLNDKLSVESGIFFSEKYYFSEGKYFDMDKMGTSMPAGMEILNLQGSSSVFEVPVKLRFDALQKNNKRLFVAAGVSSYLMVKEKNHYYTMYNGNGNDMIGSYTNTTGYVAAAFHLGIGYEQKVSKRNYLRIEPYIQIPIKGIGIGAMPVTSAGLRIGILRN